MGDPPGKALQSRANFQKTCIDKIEQPTGGRKPSNGPEPDKPGHLRPGFCKGLRAINKLTIFPPHGEAREKLFLRYWAELCSVRRGNIEIIDMAPFLKRTQSADLANTERTGPIIEYGQA